MKVEDIKVKVCLYVFDCLYLNGETLLQRPLSERRDLLKQSVKESSGQLRLATMKVRIVNYSLDIYLLFRYSLLSTYSLIVVCTCSRLTQKRWIFSRGFLLSAYSLLPYALSRCSHWQKKCWFQIDSLSEYQNDTCFSKCTSPHLEMGHKSQEILILRSQFDQNSSIASCISLI